MSDENNDRKAQEAVENREQTPATPSDTKPAGPHANDRLTDPEKTPGTGSLADESGNDADVGPD
ncbi:MAG: hypothetical protein KJ947_04690 [Alphaproteobacteria bacterium]|nr:hypothetical protein [Alphaproteobacteria bacterium]MBU1548862.1 hypothetical protein [Alphaproteobacteria bacterium]MBU2335688.1 hypothetical protein [Alphaproteobacteria bacterium]MBU2390917.1 hypothetical protein [Alphaproteobacteria bacterium]|tara:strand:- start:508 stop:699 length:192 start_codon:yes stop_codon:yes gene_type:complete